MATCSVADRYFVKAGKMFHQVDGDVEVDEGPETEVSRTDDDGAYVQAWVWVSNAEARLARMKSQGGKRT